MDVNDFFNEMKRAMRDRVEDVPRPKADDVLDALGLQRRRGASDMLLPALGIFSAGLAVGGVLGLLFAPRRGDELREELRHALPLKYDDRESGYPERDLEIARKTGIEGDRKTMKP